MIQREGPASQPAQDTQTEVLRAYPDSPHVASPVLTWAGELQLPPPEERPLRDLADALAYDIGRLRGKVAKHAANCAIWVLGVLGWRKAQRFSRDFFYVEICPRYLSAFHGVSEWGARKAWQLLKSVIGWWSVPYERIAAKVKLRALGEGQRWGQHLLIPVHAMELMKEAASQLLASGWRPPTPSTHELDFDMETDLRKLPIPASPGRRGLTVKTRCPCGEHDRGDLRPSLVLWANPGGETGGARCEVTGARYAVRFRGRKASLAHVENNDAKRRIRKPSTRENSPGPVAGTRWGPRGTPGRHLSSRLTAEGRSNVHRLGWEPLKTLKWSEMMSAGPMATSRNMDLGAIAKEAPPEDLVLLDQISLISVSEMRACGWVHRPWGPKGIDVPIRFEASRQRWLLWDLDGLIPDVGLEELEGRVEQLARGSPFLSGRTAGVRTSPEGVHVWMQLRRPVEPGFLFGSRAWRSWYERIGWSFIEAVGGVGEVDLSSFAPGRWARRPGWRLLADGTPWRTHLVWADEEGKASKRRRSSAGSSLAVLDRYDDVADAIDELGGIDMIRQTDPMLTGILAWTEREQRFSKKQAESFLREAQRERELRGHPRAIHDVEVTVQSVDKYEWKGLVGTVLRYETSAGEVLTWNTTSQRSEEPGDKMVIRRALVGKVLRIDGVAHATVRHCRVGRPA